MKDQTKPDLGGIATALNLIGCLSLLAAFLGGALANLSLTAEVILMTGTLVSACLLWAGAAVVQELRKIEFNTRRPQEATSIAPIPVKAPAPSLDEAADEYGIRKEGDKFRFGEHLYDNLRDAVNYASRQQAT